MFSKTMSKITEVVGAQSHVHSLSALQGLGFLPWLGLQSPGAPTLPSAQGPVPWRGPPGQQTATRVVSRVRLVWRPPWLGSEMGVGKLPCLSLPLAPTSACLLPPPAEAAPSQSTPLPKGSVQERARAPPSPITPHLQRFPGKVPA